MCPTSASGGCVPAPGLTPSQEGLLPHTSLNSATSRENSSGPLVSCLIEITPTQENALSQIYSSLPTKKLPPAARVPGP